MRGSSPPQPAGRLRSEAIYLCPTPGGILTPFAACTVPTHRFGDVRYVSVPPSALLDLLRVSATDAETAAVRSFLLIVVETDTVDATQVAYTLRFHRLSFSSRRRSK